MWGPPSTAVHAAPPGEPVWEAGRLGPQDMKEGRGALLHGLRVEEDKDRTEKLLKEEADGAASRIAWPTPSTESSPCPGELGHRGPPGRGGQEGWVLERELAGELQQLGGVLFIGSEHLSFLHRVSRA